MADQAPGFMIVGEHYPFAESYTFGDTVLIKRLTGLTMNQFAASIGDEDSAGDAMLGMIGAAVWRKHPDWRIDRVEQFVHHIDMGAFEMVGMDEEADAGPPAVAAEAAEPSETLSLVSTNGPVEHDSELLAPKPTGTQP